MSDVVSGLLAKLEAVEQEANEGHSLGCSSTDPCYEPPYEDGPDYGRCDCRQQLTLRLCRAHRDLINLYAGALFTQGCHPEYEGNNGYVMAIEATLQALARGLGVEHKEN